MEDQPAYVWKPEKDIILMMSKVSKTIEKNPANEYDL